LSLTGGAAGDYFYTGTCVAGLVLNPGASCYLTMAFDPTATGSRAATLQNGLSGGGSTNVNLSGNGVPADVGSDGPMPTWAYALLTALLLATAVRFRGWYV
jgi:hypothetical protein